MKTDVLRWDLEDPISSGYVTHCSRPFFMSIRIKFFASYTWLSQTLVTSDFAGQVVYKLWGLPISFEVLMPITAILIPAADCVFLLHQLVIGPVTGKIIKAEPHIRLFLKNSRECWPRIGEQVMCGSVFSYILGIRHYVPNTFSAPPNLQKRQILVNTLYESQFSGLLVNLCENARECWQIFGIRLFSEYWHVCGSTLM